ncbi:nitrate/nitrite transporter [Idiomarina sp. HP20-50]|uniref:nitrate/nitrite transporter n=1 Tax=Idiomarina sp. HP20-50 TaxID=3070813 RepID=UPI00294AE0EF|nr:nitrate/nitrite transporter [Idiomarina sp. HP20-50]MDV6316340.1 nitrate/nitrite transporter [Idiomarina sp. HP20-50]
MDKASVTNSLSDLHGNLGSHALLRWLTLGALLLGVTFWGSWSVIVVLLAKSNAELSASQLMSLVAIAGGSGAASRLLGTLVVNRLGRWMPAVIAMIMFMVSADSFVQFSATEVTYSMLALLAAMSGIGCMMFAPAFELTRQSKTSLNLPLSMSVVIGMTIFSLFLAQLAVPLLATWPLGSIDSSLVLERSSGNFFARVDEGRHILLNSFSCVWAALFAIAAVLSVGAAVLSHDQPSLPKVRVRKLLTQNGHVWYCSILYNMTFGSFIGFAMALPLVLELVFGYSTLILVWMGPFIALLARPFGRWLAGIFGGALVTQISLVLMMVFGAIAGRYMYFAQHGQTELYFEPFFMSMLGLIFTSALGNGSVVVTMTKVFPRIYTHRVLIWAGTIAMLGAVYLPLRFAWALKSQSIDTVYIDFIVFYVIGLFLNGVIYLRRHGQFYNP